MALHLGEIKAQNNQDREIEEQRKIFYYMQQEKTAQELFPKQCHAQTKTAWKFYSRSLYTFI
jgi:hypothetical protein